MGKKIKSMSNSVLIEKNGTLTNNKIYTVGLIITFLCGFSALSYQFMWSRRLVDLVGGTPEATARVFGCFFLGLAIGSILSNSLSKKLKRIWMFLAFSELLIILLTIPILTMPGWSGWIWQSIGNESISGIQGSIIKLVVPFIILTPPAVIMGILLPLIAKGIFGNKKSLSKYGTWLYASNTTGGILGIIFTVFIGLPRFGISGTLIATILLDVLIGSIFIILSKVDSASDDSEDDTSKDTVSDKGEMPKTCYIIAFFSGLSILAVEMLVIHMLNQVSISSIYTEASILIVVIMLLAVASWLTPLIMKTFKLTPKKFLTVLFIVTGISVVFIPFIFNGITNGLYPLAPKDSVASYMVNVMFLILAAAGPCFLIGGMVLPATFSYFEEYKENNSISSWGILLAVNGIGGLIGTEAANNIIMPVFGMYIGIGLVGIIYIIIALLLLDYKNKKWYEPDLGKIAFLSSIILTVVLTFGPATNLPMVNEYWNSEKEETSLIDVSSGPEGVVSVINRKNQGNLILMDNRYILGGDVVQYYQQQQAIIPAMLHPSPDRVATIGLASGNTAGTLLKYNDIKSVIATEISPIVIDKARMYFTEANQNIFNSDRAEIVKEDGRIYVAASNNEFDLIVADLFLPWGRGSARLYSVEHFKSTVKALKDGGIFCQWLPMDMLTPEEFQSIVSSFIEVYPKAYLFKISSTEMERMWFSLIGFKNGDIDYDKIMERYKRLLKTGNVEKEFILSPEELNQVYMGYATKDTDIKDSKLTTFDNAWVEISSSQSQVVKGQFFMAEYKKPIVDIYIKQFIKEDLFKE